MRIRISHRNHKYDYRSISFVQSLFLIFFVTTTAILYINGVEASQDIDYNLQYEALGAENVKQVRRTGFHFQPKRNYINDPNGHVWIVGFQSAPMYYKGMYHLFYQYNPNGPLLGDVVWAHSVSTDLINWKPLELAIIPSKPFDKYGSWSGSATILPGNKPVILYTGKAEGPPKHTQVQNYAVPANLSDPYLQKWIKPDNNPLIIANSGENGTAFRDPTTAWLNKSGYWKMLVGSRLNNTGMVYLYRSKDFMKWTKNKDPFDFKNGTGLWECPDFFPVSLKGLHGLDTSVTGKSVRHVLKISLDSTKHDYYTIGTYIAEKDRYIPDNTSLDGWAGLRLDYGNFYASKSFFDPATNRRILWGWANESDTPEHDVAKGWAGIQLIPRTILLDPSGKQLVQWPIEEIETLRGTTVIFSQKQKLLKGHRVEVKGITAAQADVEVTFSFGSLEKAEAFDPKWLEYDAQKICSLKGSTVQGGVGPFGLLTLASQKLEEYTPVFFRVFKAQNTHKVLMCSDATRSSLMEGLYMPSFAGFVEVDNIAADKKISLRSLIDNSVVESFGARGKTCISSRVYPTLAVYKNAHLYVFNNGSEIITVENLVAWSMKKPLHMN